MPLQGVELYSIILRYKFILTYFFIGMQSSEDVRTILKLSLAIAILMIGVDMQQASADNNNGDGKKCNDHHHDSGSSQCSHKDPTPFILPFP